MTPRKLKVINPTDEARRFLFEVRSLGDFVEIASPNATSPGFESLKRIAIDLEPFETGIVSLELRAEQDLPFENTLVPIMIYPLASNGEVTRTTTSFLAIAPHPGAEPVLEGLARGDDHSFLITIATTPGRTYRVESSRTLGAIDPWGPVICSTVDTGEPGTKFLAGGDQLVLQITTEPDCHENFFRVVVLP